MHLSVLQTFLTVYREGSLTAAATKLNLSKSTVSRQLRRLEEQLDRQLFTRHGEGAKPTKAGIEAYQPIERMLFELNQLSPTHPQHQRLRIAVQPCLVGFTTSVLRRFRELFPDVDIELLSTSRRLTLLQDQIDVGIRLHWSQLRGEVDLVSRPLGSMEAWIVAAPELSSGAEHPDELLTVPTVTLAAGVTSREWPLSCADAQMSYPIRLPVLRTSTLPDALRAAEDGFGMALIPEFLLGDALESGRLVRLCPRWACTPLRVSLIWLRARAAPAHVRGFIDTMLACESAPWS